MLCLTVFLVCAGLYISASIWIFAGKDETRDADVAIVLGAAAYESGPSPVYRERLNHGIRLYLDGYVEKIILTGGTAAGNSRSDAAIGAVYVVEQGVPEEDVYLEEDSKITEENLRNAAVIMSSKGCSTALIVSDPLHMKRAMLLAKDADIDAYSSPTQTTRYQSMKSKILFLAREVFYYTGYCVVRIFR